MLKAILHVNINCTDFDRSIGFYQMLGFSVALILREGANPELDRGFGLANCWGKGAVLTLRDNPRDSRIQLSNGSVGAAAPSPTPSSTTSVSAESSS